MIYTRGVRLFSKKNLFRRQKRKILVKKLLKNIIFSFLPRRPRLESSTLITRHRIWPIIVSIKSLRVTAGAAFSIFYFIFSGSHTRAKNTPCFFGRPRVKAPCNEKLIVCSRRVKNLNRLLRRKQNKLLVGFVCTLTEMKGLK